MARCKDCAFYGKECEAESQQRAVGLEPTHVPCEIFYQKQRLIDGNTLGNGIALYLAENAYLNDTAQDALEMVAKWVNEAPTVDAAPVVHGRWIGKYSSLGNCFYYHCSECGESEPRQGTMRKQAPYCPECGAKMDGGGVGGGGTAV